jgi:hypothetical protein
MRNRQLVAALLALTCSTGILAAPSDDAPRNTPRDRTSIVKVIKTFFKSLADYISPPHP